MATAPRKPKLRRYPKLPKANASLAVVKRYKERCREVDTHNNAKVAAYNKKINEIKSARTQRAALSGIGRKPKKVYKYATL